MTKRITDDIRSGVRVPGEPLSITRVQRLYGVTRSAAEHGLMGVSPVHLDKMKWYKFARLGGEHPQSVRMLILERTGFLVRQIEHGRISGLVPLPEYGEDVRDPVRGILLGMGLIREDGHVVPADERPGA